MWLPNSDPPHPIDEALRAKIEAAIVLVGGKDKITPARRLWAQSDEAVRDAVGEYVQKLTRQPTWEVTKIVIGVMEKHNSTPLHWARAMGKRDLVRTYAEKLRDETDSRC